MGGAVSTGQNNSDLIDNLLEADYIRTPSVENVFRAIDRADYFLPASRSNAYKDLAWKSGNLHLSAPCIYSEVMEGLCLQSGLSFLNLGSGTGYLSTMVGLIIGSYGTNHGVEIHEDVIQYANKKLHDFKKFSGAIDQFDFCEPKFIKGNCLCLSSDSLHYDRVYCGAACPPTHESYLKNLLKVGGILVMPLNDQLVQIKRISETNWDVRSLLPVSFAPLIQPQKGEQELISMINIVPLNLQELCRVVIRHILRKNLDEEYPNLKSSTLPEKVPKKKRALRRLAVPFFDTSEDISDNEEENGRRRDLGRVNVEDQDCERTRTLLDIVLERLRERSIDSAGVARLEENDDPLFSDSSLEDVADDEAIVSADEPIEDFMPSLMNTIASVDTVPNILKVGSSSENREVPVMKCDSYHVTAQEADTNTDSKVQSQQVTAIIEHPRAGIDDDRIDNSDDRIEQPSSRVLRKIEERGGYDDIEEVIESDTEPQDVELQEQAQQYAGEASGKNTTKPKREKFDSGLGDEMVERDSSVDLSSDDVENLMDVDSSASSDDNHEEKRHKRFFGSQRLVPSGKMRRVLLPNPIFDSDSEGEFQEESIKSNEVNTVLNPYTPLMKNKISDLPLPTVLKKYLNYYRDF